MTEYIEREALEKALCEERDKIYRDAKSRYLNGKRDGFNEAHSLMLEIPAADVAPVRHDRWIASHDEFCTCSICKYPVYVGWNQTNYCPNCGCRMDLEG